MFPVIQIGPLALQAPGLMLLLGLWLGLTVAEKWAKRFKVSVNLMYNLVFISIIAGLVGARLTYALQNIPVFAASPLSLFSLNPGLLDPLGGLAVALITAWVYGSRKNALSWRMMDALSGLFAVMMVAIGISTLASGKAFGMETTLPWGIDLWGATRHPTQIYLALAGLAILGILWPRGGDADSAPRVPGETFVGFAALASAAILFIEGFRGDSLTLPNGIRLVQVAAWLSLAVSLWGLGKLKGVGRD
jgi:prolipoprotein diacylglyceryltransferase